MPTPTTEAPATEIELLLTRPDEDVEDQRAAFDDDLEWWIIASSTCGGVDPDTARVSSGC